MSNKMGLNGKFTVTHLDKDGNVKGEHEFPNGIVTVGLNHILETQFRSGTQVATWYIGLINNSGFSSIPDSDTMASHSGWTELAAYSESTRRDWTPVAAASRSMTNSATVDFTMNSTNVVRGIFVTSSSTKSGTTGTLWSTAAFASNASVVNSDVLKITYTISG